MMLIHASIWNKEHVDVSLWPFALSHSCFIWNTVPKLNQFSPIKLLHCTMTARNYSEIQYLHTWSCPVCIL